MKTIRSARQDDGPQLVAVGMRAWESAVEGWVNTGLLRENAERAFVAFVANNYLSIDVMEQGGRILAWAARENFDNKISDIWVEPDHHGQGLGTELLARLESEIEANGYDRAMIETHAQNVRAIEFLKKRGYSISWMTAVWSPQLDREVDTVGMVKAITQGERAQAYGEF